MQLRSIEATAWGIRPSILFHLLWWIGLGAFGVGSYHSLVAQPDEDPFKLVASWPGYTRGSVSAVAKRGTTLYLAQGGSLGFADVTNPNQPHWLGRLDTDCQDVVIRGQVAYLASGDSLGVVDLSDPTHPVLHKSIRVEGWIATVLIADDALFAAGDSLRRFDLGDPLNPKETGRLAEKGTSLAAANGFLLIATDGVGLRVVDFSNPAAPSIRGIFSHTTSGALSVCVGGQWAFLSIPGLGVYVLDVSNPERPAWNARLPFQDIRSMTATSSWALLAGERGGVTMFEIEGTNLPTEISHLMTRDQYRGKPTGDGGEFWIPYSDSGATMVRLGESKTLNQEGKLEAEIGESRDLAVSGGRLFVADGRGGLAIISRNSRDELELLGRFRTNAPVDAVRVNGDHAAILSVFRPIFLDVSDPSNVRYLGDAVSNGGPMLSTCLALIDGYAFLGGLNGLWQARLADLPHCICTNLLSLGQVHDLALRGSELVACGTSGVWVFDISDPAQPKMIGKYQLPGVGVIRTFQSLGLFGDTAYAVLDNIRLVSMDFRNPRGPYVFEETVLPGALGRMWPVGQFALGTVGEQLSLISLTPTGTAGVALSATNTPRVANIVPIGNEVYLAQHERGVAIRTLPPVAPGILQAPRSGVISPSESNALRIAASGTEPLSYQWFRDGHVLFGANSNSLVLNSSLGSQTGYYSVVVSNAWGAETAPAVRVRAKASLQFEEIGSFSVSAKRIEVQGDRAYLAAGGEGVICLDVSDGRQPRLVWQTSFSGPASDLRIQGDQVYVAADSAGLVVLNGKSGKIIGRGIADGRVAVAIEVLDSLVYLATASNGLVAVNVVDPTNPTEFYQFPHGLTSLARDRHVLVGIGPELGVVVFDLQTSAEGLLGHTVASDGIPIAVTPGDNCFVITQQGSVDPPPLGLQVIDSATPERPRAWRQTSITASTSAIRAVGHLVYLATAADGLQLFDFTDPEAPVQIARLVRQWDPTGVSVSDNKVYVLASGRLTVFETVSDKLAELELAQLADGKIQLRWTAGRGAELHEAALLAEDSWIAIPDSRARDEWTPATNKDSRLFRLLLPSHEGH